jgi:hypothetical protein
LYPCCCVRQSIAALHEAAHTAIAKLDHMTGL